MRRFELSDGKSNKFWSVLQKGKAVTVRFGRIGTDGQTRTKDHASPAEAKAAAAKLIASKEKKGYVEVAKKTAKKTAPSFDRAALRRKLASWLRKESPKKKYLRGSDSFRALLDQARESLLGKDTGQPLNLEVEGAYGSIFYEYDILLDWWLGNEGASFMVNAFFERWRYDAWGHAHANFDDRYYCWVKKHTYARQILREKVRLLDRKAYAEAKKAAGKLRKKATLPMRCAIAFAFPGEASWAKADAQALLAGDEVAEKVMSWWPVFAAELLASLHDMDLAERLAETVYPAAAVSFALDMPEQAGDAAAGPLAILLKRAKGKNKKVVAEALQELPTAASAQALARAASDKQCVKALSAFAAAHPRLAACALAGVVASRSKSADAAEQLLSKLATSERELVKAAIADGSASEKKVLKELLAAHAPKKAASRKSVPETLVSPPWAKGETPATAPRVAGLEPLELDERIEWDPGQRDNYGRPMPMDKPGIDLDDLRRWDELPKALKPRTKKMNEAVEKKFRKKKKGRGYLDRIYFVSSFLHQATDPVALALWNETDTKVLDADQSDVGYVLGRFGTKAIAGALRQLQSNANLFPVAAHIGSVSLAEKMADGHHRMKKAGPHARAWMKRFPEHAAAGLIPLALSAASAKTREAACSALRYLGSEDAKVVDKLAKRYGKDARAAVAEIVATDLLRIFPAKLKKAPAWLDVASLPRPILANGKGALPEEALLHMCTMLSFSTTDAPYPALQVAQQTCDAASLANFAWGLFQQWLMAGGAGKDDWALMSLGLYGNDETARKLAPLIRAWPGESAHGRAVKGLDVLTAIGSDIALMHLAGIAHKVKFKGLQAKANERIEQVAETRGLTRHELADRLVPDLGLDTDGSRTLSFGARAFRVGFDEALVPFVKDEDGKQRTNLPKPNRSDDAAAAKEAAAIWKALKKDARTIAKQELWRLEHAMCSRRTWDAATFRTFLIEHPLTIHIVRRLICAVMNKKGDKIRQTFMVDEERKLVDASDEGFELADDAIVAIPHALMLSTKLATAWGSRLADYELLQPFKQLGRDSYGVEAKDIKGRAIRRFDGATVPTGKVLGLEKRGWRKGSPQDAGWIWDMRKDLGDGVEAVLGLGGGLLAGDMSESPKEQKLESLEVRKEHTYDAKGVVDPKALDPIIYSELIRDIEGLRSEG